jgi:hypothetical protein
MLAALQSTHQHADTKAGILAAAQGALVGTAGAWNRQAVRAWEHGGWSGAVSAGLLALFALGLTGGAGCLALAVWPRLLRPSGPNRFSFVTLARSPVGTASTCPPTGTAVMPVVGTSAAGSPPDPWSDRAAEHRELAETVRFLARVALIKHRFLMAAVVFTTAMGLGEGLFLIMRPVLT